MFRDSQQVVVEGQTGWADFSSRADRWAPFDERTRDLHLRAFDKGVFAEDLGKNALLWPLGDGAARPVVVEYPNASVADE